MIYTWCRLAPVLRSRKDEMKIIRGYEDTDPQDVVIVLEMYMYW